MGIFFAGRQTGAQARVSVLGCQFVGGMYGISGHGISGGTVNGAFLIDQASTFDGQVAGGVFLKAREVSILGARLVNQYQSAITAYADSNVDALIKVIGNTIISKDDFTGATGAFLYGIHAGSGKGMALRGNVITLAVTPGNPNPTCMYPLSVFGLAPDSVVTDNKIKVVAGLAAETIAMDFISMSGSTIKGNQINFSNTNMAYNHFGMYFYGCSGNTISGNNINMVNGLNGATKDVGLYLNPTSKNNTGLDNGISNAGETIRDGNTDVSNPNTVACNGNLNVAGIDGGTW